MKNIFCCRAGEVEIVLAHVALTICETMRSRIEKCVKMASNNSGIANTREAAVAATRSQEGALSTVCDKIIVEAIRDLRHSNSGRQYAEVCLKQAAR